MLIDFIESELMQMILSQVEENLHLDYKGAGSLSSTDSKKKEIAKDISAFANSDGGMVIYGIREFDDAARRHLPEKLDPIDRNAISKEWLEQVINSNIQPKIENLTIHPITLSSAINHVAYVIKIPKSNTAHKASDKKYYKRYNFESVAMEDYEIKDIINRLSSPQLSLVLDPLQTTFNLGVLRFPIILNNKSKRLAKDVKMSITFNDFQNYDFLQTDGFTDESRVNLGRKIYSSTHRIIVYNGLNAHIGFFQLQLHENIFLINVTVTIYADNMLPETITFAVAIVNNTPIFLPLNY
jgi:hypothetical protein